MLELAVAADQVEHEALVAALPDLLLSTTLELTMAAGVAVMQVGQERLVVAAQVAVLP